MKNTALLTPWTGALAIIFGLFLSGQAAFAGNSNLDKPPATYTPDVSYTLKTNIGSAGMTYLGVGGTIDGVNNPTLRVKDGDIVQITLIDGDGAEHDISIPEFKVLSDHVVGQGASTVVVFRATSGGTYNYFCTLPGHRAAGMQGKLVVGKGEKKVRKAALADIVRDPSDLPGPIAARPPKVVKIALEAQEIEGQLSNGVTYNYWTFNGKVPGPFMRVRVGDTVQLTLKNKAGDHMIHSIDLHAVTGPGGGAKLLQVPPGGSKTISFKALKPGLFVYHCATPMVAQHIANGMYGMILVEPKGGLPKVDHEFYVMQGELYTTGAFNQHGHQEFDIQKLLEEQPTYFVYNGAVGALTHDHPMHAKVGDTIRIYFGVGGPNMTSSFHMIGEIMDRVWPWGSIATPPDHDVQTISVPPGGAAVADFELQVPGTYLVVDHALSRLEKGLVGHLIVSGKQNPAIYKAGKAL